MRILLALDQSDASEKALQFVAERFVGGNAADAEITLLHVAESLPDFLVAQAAQRDPDNLFGQIVEEWEASRQVEGDRLLNRSKTLLIEAGIAAESVQTKLIARESRPESVKVVAALGIIEELKQGPHDVVVLGRRAASLADVTYLGSVAEKVTREAKGKTVVIVD